MGRPGAPREWQRQFWQLIRGGCGIEAAALTVGVSYQTGKRWFVDGGGMPTMSLKPLSGRYLSFYERELIALLRAGGYGVREIARQLGRAPSTVSRELRRNSKVAWPWHYMASVAQDWTDRRARRPKLSKLAQCPQLLQYVQVQLTSTARLSPEQISHRLVVDFPDDEQMRISHEAIYQALYVQGRGELRRELTRCLRTGRTLRKPRRRPDERRGRISNMVMISERPPEVEDRAVPGHWEGDLIVGEDGKSAIGTLVERTTRLVLLLHLGRDRHPETVRDAIAAAIMTLPAELRRSVTWDQGREMARHAELKLATGMDIYFCDPHSPWQRGSNENTNGLLRQYFPKGTDLSVHSPEHLAEVAAGLNGRPRKTLDWKTPREAFNELLFSLGHPTGVATTD